MLLELVRDNQRVLDRISDKQIESFIFWLKRSRDPAFLQFLEALCVCENVYVAYRGRWAPARSEPALNPPSLLPLPHPYRAGPKKRCDQVTAVRL